MALIINNLGSYPTIESVWLEHPEGGREGDYVTVGGSIYYWDKYSRCWVQTSATPSSGGQVVDGDLSVGGNLGVGGNAVINGRLFVNGVEVIPGQGGGGGDSQGGSGQLVFKSIVFRRSPSRPASPQDGAFGNPIPTGWSDGVPVGSDPIWMSSRYFTSDNLRPAGVNNDSWNVWTTPALMSDTDDYDVEFSSAAASSVPIAPPEDESDRTAAGWFDPIRDPNANWSQMKWMATRTKYTNSAGQPVWTSWKIMLIKGEQGEPGNDGANGDGFRSVYAKAAKGVTPTITSQGYPPTGNVTWRTSVSQLTLNAGEVLWMSEKRCREGVWANWSTPVRISGADGADGSAGEDGADIEFIYKPSNTLPGANDTAPESVDADGDVPSGWFDHPNGVGTITVNNVTSFYKYEWMCQRVKPAGTDQAWGEWVGPFVWSAYGDKGMDGDGVEYIYRQSESTPATATLCNPSYTYRRPSDSNPNILVNNTVDNYRGGVYSSGAIYYPEGWDDHGGEWEFVGWNGGHYENGEWIPAGWSDDPRGVNSTDTKEWVSTRKRHNGVWSDWSAPALWATYSAEHIVSIDSEGYWCVDGNRILVNGQPVKAEGKDGTGVEVKGSVEVLNTTSGKTALQDVQNPNLGDCYIVDDDGTNQGHLYIYIGGSGTFPANWKDLGPFRGQPGTSSIMHIAWCDNIVFKTVGGVKSVDETNSSELIKVYDNQPHDWMGLCVNESQSDPDHHNDYEWTYLKGQDGRDVEFVYIRTKTNVAPGWTNNYTDSNGHTSSHPEYLPCVNDNYAGEAEEKSSVSRAEYTDDPQGVNRIWPYEWMLKRVKADGAWGNWNNGGNAVLWGNWSASRPWVKTEVSQIVVDADSEGKIPTQKDIRLKCWLYYGEEVVIPTGNRCSATYGGTAIALGIINIDNSNPYITVPVTLPANTPLESKDIVVNMANADFGASATVPVVINRGGAAGATGPSLRFRGEWDDETEYVNNATVRDCVKFNSSFWALLTATTPSGITTSSPGTVEGQWLSLGNMGFVATELLLAENGSIDLLSSNCIKMFNTNGALTASINEDQHGSYRIYYPNGNILMEFSWEGYIIYRNNDADNTKRWSLGYGGAVQQGDNWTSVFYAFLGAELPSSFGQNSSWTLTEYFRFDAGAQSTQPNNGKIYNAKDIISGVITAGYYTSNIAPVRQGTVYKIAIYFVSSGKIRQTGWLYSGGDYYLDDV